MPSTFISADELSKHLNEKGWVIVDCRYVLGRPQAGKESYRQGHIPGARYADLEDDLSGTVVAGLTGRHPLPAGPDLVSTLRRLGISNDSQVIAYDDGSGQMAAARLWWLLKWAGHQAVAVLDGGLAEWVRKKLPLSSGAEPVAPGRFEARFRHEMVATTDQVLASLDAGGMVLADSRTPDRFRGENENIDPVAGHIPGAVSVPFLENLDAGGRGLPPEQLRARFESLPRRGSEMVFYCGSGVTAAQNVLAHCAAGLSGSRLYAGSWSEWITDPGRPVETGGAA
ncbi:MAG TPA: sulfurtransferase [Actinomycetota bacterium]|nr:sulfurtransferase [Actinomycetota bacterium]